MDKKFIMYLQLFMLSINLTKAQDDCICGFMRDNFSFVIDYKYFMTNSYIYSIIEDIEKYAMPQVKILQIQNFIDVNDKRKGVDLISRDNVNNLPRQRDSIQTKHIFYAEIIAQTKQQFLRSKVAFKAEDQQSGMRNLNFIFKQTFQEYNPSNQKRGFIYYGICQHFLMFLRKFSWSIKNQYEKELINRQNQPQLQLTQTTGQKIGKNGESIMKQQQALVNDLNGFTHVWNIYNYNLGVFSQRQNFIENKQISSLLNKNYKGCTRQIEFDNKKHIQMALFEFSQFKVTKQKTINNSNLLIFQKINLEKKKKKKQLPPHIRLYQDALKKQKNKIQKNDNSQKTKKKFINSPPRNNKNNLNKGKIQANQNINITARNQQTQTNKNQRIPVTTINLDLDINQTQQRGQNNVPQKNGNPNINISNQNTSTNNQIRENINVSQQKQSIQTNLKMSESEHDSTEDYSTDNHSQDDQSSEQDINIVNEHQVNMQNQQLPMIPEQHEVQDLTSLQIDYNAIEKQYKDSFIALNLNLNTLTIQDNKPILSPQKQKLLRIINSLIINIDQDIQIINQIYLNYEKNKQQPNENLEKQLKNSPELEQTIILFQGSEQIDFYLHELLQLRKAGFFMQQNNQMNRDYEILYMSSNNNYSFERFITKIQAPGQSKLKTDLQAFISLLIQENEEKNIYNNLIVYQIKGTDQLFTNIEFNLKNINYGSFIYELILDGGYIGISDELLFEIQSEIIVQTEIQQFLQNSKQTTISFKNEIVSQFLQEDQIMDLDNKQKMMEFIYQVNPAARQTLDTIQLNSSNIQVNLNGNDLYIINFNEINQPKCTSFIKQIFILMKKSAEKKLKEYEEFLKNFDIFDFTRKKQYKQTGNRNTQQIYYDKRNDIYLQYYNNNSILDLLPDLSNPLINTMVDPLNRTKMIDWFIKIQVSLKFERFYDVLFRAICLFDCFTKFSKIVLTDTDLYSYGSTILYIANKYELIHPFSLSEYCQQVLCNNFHPKTLCKLEFEIIRCLNFKFVYTTYYELVCTLLTKFISHKNSLKFEEFQNLTSLIMLICMYDLNFNNLDQIYFGSACILVSIEIFFTHFNKKRSNKYNQEYIIKIQKKFLQSIMNNFGEQQISTIKKIMQKVKRQVEKVYQTQKENYVCGTLLDKLLQKMFA